MDPPEPVSADDDERVARTVGAQRRQRVAQVVDGVVGCREQVDHLVARARERLGLRGLGLQVLDFRGLDFRGLRRQVPGRRPGRDPVGASRGRARDEGRGGDEGRWIGADARRVGARRHGGKRLQQYDDAAPARVDDAGPAQCGELFRGADQGLARGVGGGARGPGGAAAADRRGAVGGGAHDGQHRALDGPGDRAVAEVGGPAQRVGERVTVELGGRHQRLGEAAQELAEDDAGVAAGAEQGAVGERLDRTGRAHVGQVVIAVVALAERTAGRLEGEEQVGAGVGVRDREDVERVDLLTRAAERGERRDGPVADGRAIHQLLQRIRHAVPLLS